MLSWQEVSWVGLVAIAECWGFALVLYRVSTAGSAARLLAWVLVAEGAALVTSGIPETALGLTGTEPFFQDHPAYGQLAFILHTLADAAMVALYPPFLAVALNTKLTRSFAGKPGRILTTVAATTMFLLVQVTPLKIGATVLYLSLSLLFGFALVASIHAWTLAAPGIARTRAKVFAIAFGLRDLCWGLVYGGSIYMVWAGTYTQSEGPYDLPLRHLYILGTLIAIPIVAYGILRTQLFDIDLRIRWAIKQSTIGAAIAVLMFVLSEGAEMILSDEFGTMGGLSGAVLGVILLSPLKRFAERVASKAMPNTRNTPEYIADRKLQVYESALSEVLFDGNISDKEKALLAHLRDSLGISASESDAIEMQLKSRNLSYG